MAFYIVSSIRIVKLFQLWKSQMELALTVWCRPRFCTELFWMIRFLEQAYEQWRIQQVQAIAHRKKK
ncbi:unnamed protein product [Rotaria magnacalcarata]